MFSYELNKLFLDISRSGYLLAKGLIYLYINIELGQKMELRAGVCIIKEFSNIQLEL